MNDPATAEVRKISDDFLRQAAAAEARGENILDLALAHLRTAMLVLCAINPPGGEALSKAVGNAASAIATIPRGAPPGRLRAFLHALRGRSTAG